MICKNCGSEINENAKFCPKCGAPVEPVPDAASSPNNGAGVTENEGGTTAGILTKKTVKLDNYVSVEFAGLQNLWR